MKGLEDYGPTVPCELCTRQTPMLGTKLCDRCWELKTRITGNLELARKILATIDAENG